MKKRLIALNKGRTSCCAFFVGDGERLEVKAGVSSAAARRSISPRESSVREAAKRPLLPAVDGRSGRVWGMRTCNLALPPEVDDSGFSGLRSSSRNRKEEPNSRVAEESKRAPRRRFALASLVEAVPIWATVLLPCFSMGGSVTGSSPATSVFRLRRTFGLWL